MHSHVCGHGVILSRSLSRPKLQASIMVPTSQFFLDSNYLRTPIYCFQRLAQNRYTTIWLVPCKFRFTGTEYGSLRRVRGTGNADYTILGEKRNDGVRRRDRLCWLRISMPYLSAYVSSQLKVFSPVGGGKIRNRGDACGSSSQIPSHAHVSSRAGVVVDDSTVRVVQGAMEFCSRSELSSV